ncbi:unnamed protein product [Rotaria magnacalcarata]|uniref:Uncharacterized protein n=1 Tax=Rotaria magnacalcarata TaxID=392030 RepID=A0A8S3DGE5_9BILA|nr:unnamed protein product [Rotaria magnacalcarata]
MVEKQYLSKIALVLIFLAFDDASFYWIFYEKNKDFHNTIRNIRSTCSKDLSFKLENIIIIFRNAHSNDVRIDSKDEKNSCHNDKARDYHGNVQQVENIATYTNFTHAEASTNIQTNVCSENVDNDEAEFKLVVRTKNKMYTCDYCKALKSLSDRRIRPEEPYVKHEKKTSHYHLPCSKTAGICKNFYFKNLSKTKTKNVKNQLEE